MVLDRGNRRRLVVLGTGGTIAGTAASAGDDVGYTAARVGIADLLAGVPELAAALRGHELVAEQVAQIDSKDMGEAVWRQLLQRSAHWLEQPGVASIVVTHGTDTLEESAWLLQEVLAPARPVVFACAMRPASSAGADGPRNLADAVAVALQGGARGVTAVCAGRVHGAADVQKVHPYRLDAFDSGDAGPLGYVEEGRLRLVRGWPDAAPRPRALERLLAPPAWPRVEIVSSHGGADGAVLRALLQADQDEAGPLRGVVLAATGNGSVNQGLEAAARMALERGVRVVRAMRCPYGQMVGEDAPRQGVAGQALAAIPRAPLASPVKARLSLLLELLEEQPGPAGRLRPPRPSARAR